MKSRIAIYLLVLAASSPAFAHQGDHTHFDLAGLIAHVFETDHIVFALIAVLTGVLAYRAGRRAEARAHIRRTHVGKE
jgi:hydrogenase/urease accessory protein HupE